jgi:predicted nucleic acid-binding protein
VNLRYVFDTGALIDVERRRGRVARFVGLAELGRAAISTPMSVVSEWWRGRSDRREEILRFVKIEPLTLAIAKAAGEALAKAKDVEAKLTIDAQVMATAALRGGIVLTKDVDDLEKLRIFFPSVRILAV